ncbi:MAG: YkgJ family cysteine cluster protein [Anaerolineae bacterium]|nr:YkgJ family cysteine cluster protein [Anaerolineae bacterium]
MEASNKNVCLSCSIEQDCCRNMSGLRLSEKEYKEHFDIHLEKLVVKQVGRLYSVSGKDGASCPNWIGEQCSVYETRPMECRLFPFTLGKVAHINDRVDISYHSRTQCPEKKILLMSQVDAHEMISTFAEDVFSDVDKINIEHERLFTRLKYKIKKYVA